MTASSREEIVEILDEIDALQDKLSALTFDALTTPEHTALAQRLERQARRPRAVQHAVINQLEAQATKQELGGSLASALADLLHITKSEAGRRVADARLFGPRRALTGEPLGPLAADTAAAHRDGRIGDGHLKVIRDFLNDLPPSVDLGVREAAEAQLAQLAVDRRPDELAGLAAQLLDWLHPDGDFSDEERARQRGITLGKQHTDGMSKISGLINPELRATLEAVLAKLAAPGACNPNDETPHVDNTPDQDAVDRDTRNQQQRNHDGMLAGLRALLASGKLGQHRGLPVSIVITATLQDLEAATGKGLTGGGSKTPMSDVIRMASHAHHYLALFDGAKPLALYHTKRLASPAQRIMLYARDRGCTRPGCSAPAYHSEVHHVSGWKNTGRTDITDLALACTPDNQLVEDGAYTTRTTASGHTEWLRPPHLDHGQPRINLYHHPEKLLAPDEDDDDPD
ncbi:MULTISPECIES: HNH endonuclease signature motif containing protein [Mycobacterium]|uniref:HNH nuclease domain-containing protein n=1 Tax=Mycobacterium kiyosense TaxID=2871094 RepID=A0A9P3Q9H2_9MYCO|nr:MULTISPECIES: HNH endonuclease signature motif containing protein [Mycobacterium]BDB41406.1 hypothetical protein IWGMT90018_18520 [Mycobacterium kiyosense]BDE13160.1 hypothetical protein MKCMC460_20200 [Mycobacterium sp. 20KCMC460]GLB90605.1 hypothetical protein SRL2020130_34220 [Mycobacterium kiyosense]GLB96601.1 hypothetical protein SRL2020226_33770 [Mycobacterium kiyosense]GLC03205.1 hypothetical protein SRL2020400_37960 [Mycobacterium kiyosense]